MGVAQTAPIIVSNEPAFTIVDTSGNTLHFDRFAYERSVEAAHGEYFDANRLRCRITLQARVEPVSANALFKQSVNAQLLTTEIKELSDSLNAVLSSAPGTERTASAINARYRADVAHHKRIVTNKTTLPIL